ncbi:hypothetical protein CYMTET_14370 [Cymbomonas tetramitiformis]|uniref:Multiple C2 domain-containing protein n=1 Tax=Cymbomonas tetramitiformis TaxID=36881 RepID=A0AAE0GG84_9CHLO|nr:hypothetical protein CYMTET_14370 [Cymbomonas tetramitiformis]
MVVFQSVDQQALARLQTERTKEPKWDERLVFPVHDTSSTFVLAVFNMSKSSNRLAATRMRRAVPWSAYGDGEHATWACLTRDEGACHVGLPYERCGSITHVESTYEIGSGNQRYAKRVNLHKITSEGKLVNYGALNIALTFKYTTGQSMDMMGRYLEPPLPPKNFWHPLPGTHGLRMETRRKEIIAESLSQSNPPILYDLCMEVLDGKESTFDMRVLKAHLARLNKCISYMAPLGDNFALAQSWKNPFFSTIVNCVTLVLIFNAHVIPPLMLLWMLVIGLRNYPKRFEVQMDFIGIDPDLSMGLSEEEVAKAKRKAEKTGEEEEEDEAGELTDSSLNPFASLQKQYNEMMEVASSIQIKLDGASTQMEQAFGMLQWLDPRCTGMILFGCFMGCVVLSTFFVLNAFRMQVGFAALAMIFLKPPGVTDPSPSPPENMIARVPTRRDRILIT